MRHLFDDWAAVAGRVNAARSIALFLDFDGTLSAIADRPEQACLSTPARRVLERLALCRTVRLCIVSGRDYSSLSRAVGLPGVRCLGLYGWEDDNGFHLGDFERAALAAARRDLASRLEELPGIWIEGKGSAFAVHHRGALEASVRSARSALRLALAPFGETLRLLRAKKAWDVLPVSILCKGAAVRRELSEHPADLAIYAGDDLADECAFAAIEDGISIQVGARSRSQARYSLRNPDEVRLFLEKLEGELS